MAERVARARRYEASLDRAGLALGAGALLGGVLTAAAILLSGAAQAMTLLVAFVTGMVITAMAAIGIGGPLWAILHAAGRRGPRSAAATGGVAGLALFLGGQTWGYALFAPPLIDDRGWIERWAGTVAVALTLALAAAAIGWTMWRVAYRRAG